jgi:hypothetical protein
LTVRNDLNVRSVEQLHEETMTEKFKDLKTDLVRSNAFKPYIKPEHLVLNSFKITSSDNFLPILPNIALNVEKNVIA